MAEKEEKKPFVLRLNVSIMRDLEKWAADEFRSVNGQIEYVLRQAMKESGKLTQKKDRL